MINVAAIRILKQAWEGPESRSSMGDMEGRALCYSYLIPQKKGKSSDQLYISLTANANILKLVLICQSWEGVKRHRHTHNCCCFC